MDWNDGVTIGTVGNSCKPNTGISSNVIEGGGREWMVNIYSNGSINLRLLNGSVTTGDRISLNFDYSKKNYKVRSRKLEIRNFEIKRKAGLVLSSPALSLIRS